MRIPRERRGGGRTESHGSHIDRRTFLKRSSAGGAALVLGFHLPCGVAAIDRTFRPNAWIRITADNRITVLTEMPEMGQGRRSVDAMMLAEELDADWSAIRVEQAPVVPEIYQHLSTGGSGGTGTAWEYLRKAGAQARDLLLAAAAQSWGVAKQDCRTENSTVHGPHGRHCTYGELVETAAKLAVPEADGVRLKSPSEFRLIGKGVARVDIPGKVDGSAQFGIDVRVPGMLFAVIARCPHFGGKLASYDATRARAIRGVHAIFPVAPLGFEPKLDVNINTAGGVAIVADSTRKAIQAREALDITWDKGPGGSETSESLSAELKQQASAPATFVAVNRGTTDPSDRQLRRVEADYELPFQAHATMEPMNATVHVRDDGIEVWSPTQIGAEVQKTIAALAGIPPARVTVHMMLCGGSFGRRYQWDFVAEAWQVAREVKQPVQLLWTRADDMRHDFYRQYSYHRLSGALDSNDGIALWSHRVVSTPIRTVFDPPEKLKDPRRVALQELSGADVLPYVAATFRLDYAPIRSVVPRAWWRSVGHSFNAFAMECFVDELAHAAGIDPYEFRLRQLREERRVLATMWPDDPPLETRRLRGVLQLAATKAGWGTPLPPGQGRGIAGTCSFGSYIAHVAEVWVEKEGTVHVRRIVSAVDCGTAVDPNGVRAMTEGAINYALTPVLSGEITIKDGAVEQENFDRYRVLRINDAPDIEVHIVPSSGEPGGMGETGVPPLAPAVANAVFAATGVRVRRLPIDSQLLKR